MKLVGFSNKLRVVLDWTLDLLVERSISQIHATRQSAVLEKLAEEQGSAYEPSAAAAHGPSHPREATMWENGGRVSDA